MTHTHLLKSLFLCCCLLFYRTWGNAQQLQDLSTISDAPSLAAWFKKAKEAQKAAGLYQAAYRYVFIDSALYRGLKVYEVTLYEQELKMTIGNDQAAGLQRLIGQARQQYGNALVQKESYSSMSFEARTADENFLLTVEAENETAIRKKTTARLERTFKQVADYAYPRLSKTIQPDANGIFYYLETDTYNTNLQIHVNGIPVADKGSSALILNPFILSAADGLSVTILVNPGTDEMGMPEQVIGKRSYFAATLYAGTMQNGTLKPLKAYPLCEGYKGYVTDTLMEDGHEVHSSYMGNPKYGTSSITCTYQLQPKINYTLEGWRNGTDLRTETGLKEQVIALYEKLSRAILDKDAREFDDLLILQGKERATSTYNATPGQLVEDWEAWMELFAYTNITRIEKDFDLIFSNDGKLVYAVPKTQLHMLRAIGKNRAAGFSFYMYKSGKELKFIR